MNLVWGYYVANNLEEVLCPVNITDNEWSDDMKKYTLTKYTLSKYTLIKYKRLEIWL